MISKKYSAMLNNTSIIREFAQYASKRAAEIGAENVFNYTIGLSLYKSPDPRK